MYTSAEDFDENSFDSEDFTTMRMWHSDLLSCMLMLRETFRVRYKDLLSLPGWSVLDEVQQDENLRFFADSSEHMREQVLNTALKKNLKKAIVGRDRFLFSAYSDRDAETVAKVKEFARGLKKSVMGLSKLFMTLYFSLHKMDQSGGLQKPKADVGIERRDASGLSVKEFFESYATQGVPVIITGLNLTEGEAWSLDFFSRKCNTNAIVKRENSKATTWAKLEQVASLPLPEFIRTFSSNKTRRSWYLHDWALPESCPEVFGPPPYQGFTMPKYFVGDYFQRIPYGQYQHTWPSLFIGSEETRSPLHVDSGQTNFWLYLLSGKKKWKLFSRHDVFNLYRSVDGNVFHVDPFKPDLALKQYPLLKYARAMEATQTPGELLFIPAGTPHAVQNLEPIHGISMNYVDASNVWMHLMTLFKDRHKLNSFERFIDPKSFSHGISSEQTPMAFGEWKSVRWNDLSYDLKI
eukprot:TRINITY_DN8170_c0_g1_i2.p1 TRINITY_DN8170_c0_g1~~TRINITY_DN8170_c0_g1_i2.p1  ORF type:complete len:471 (-),score=62.48 TRINITY_DN8170_c0_g1_i2:79-1470(-)